jgi:hypothetical protein
MHFPLTGVLRQFEYRKTIGNPWVLHAITHNNIIATEVLKWSKIY